MKTFLLQQAISPEDSSWKFQLPPQAFDHPKSSKHIWGKQVKFTSTTTKNETHSAARIDTTAGTQDHATPFPASTRNTSITFQMGQFSSNRVIRSDDHTKFVLVSFEGLRLPEPSTMRDGMEYIEKFLNKGLWINGTQYRFYHHSNSQLRGRSCWMREANSDEELDERVYALGNLKGIMNVAKRAKRIGLLFSSAEIDYTLDPSLIRDIPDIQHGDELFSDGCGLISRRLMRQLAKAKDMRFRGNRYIPCVIQIRYLGYKGVLMLHPDIDKHDAPNLVHFRSSMKKFTATVDPVFSVVNYSKPYTFGRLNNDIIALINSLGVTTDKLLAKQAAYFDWVKRAAHEPVEAIDFMSALGKFEWVERILLDGLEDAKVQDAIRSAQKAEMVDMRPNAQEGKFKSRMIIHQSRRLYGVCDPYGVLKEGQVHIRVTSSRKGETTPVNADVLVTRNPCLHPGDCLKLRAVSEPKLSHLVDCIVFATVAKPGHPSAPSMSSGGDLDGDEYFVCWDPDLVQPIVSEPYDYPPNKESSNLKVTRANLVRHFAFYSGAGVAQVSRLHAQWARISPKGTLSSQCQELNALHSQSVDGARIKIPDRLKPTPEQIKAVKEPYVLDVLGAAADKERTAFAASPLPRLAPPQPGGIDVEDVKALMVDILQSDDQALLVLTEFQRFELVLKLARHHGIDPSELRLYLPHIDYGALSAREKMSLSVTLGYGQGMPELWNSLFRSDIVTHRDLYQRQLDRPYPLQRLYSSRMHGLETFFQYLRRGTQEYHRKLLIIKTDERFSVGIFMRGPISWDELTDSVVGENVVVCSFMSQSTSQHSLYRPCGAGYKLHLSYGRLQLYDKVEGSTFIFITKPPTASAAQVATSIALERISPRVKKQMGRVFRSPLTAIEIHVISNRDRVAHQLFDLWFTHVPTEAVVRRFEREVHHYERNSLKDVDWDEHPKFAPYFTSGDAALWSTDHLKSKQIAELEALMRFCIEYHQEDDLFTLFKVLISLDPMPLDPIIKQIELYPPLAFALLHAYPPTEDLAMPDSIVRLAFPILQGIIKSANEQGMACLVALEKVSRTVGSISIEHYFSLLMLASCCVRSKETVQEVLLVLSDCRREFSEDTAANLYVIKHSLAVAVDRAEEAADTCPCDDRGRPRRQRTPPSQAILTLDKEKPNHVKASVRVDARTAIRLHSHVRIQAASRTTNEWTDAPIVDGLVVGSPKGEYIIETMYPLPPEVERMDWNLYDSGSTATAQAMIDALQRLSQQGDGCCRYVSAIVGSNTDVGLEPVTGDHAQSPSNEPILGLNESQADAVCLCDSAQLSLIWGPPGTGKTTVVVQILRRLLESLSPDDEETKVLMTASTHNAVDNVLERFIEDNKKDKLLSDEQILRVATDVSKVSKRLQDYTINARVGGDMTENNKLFKQAKQRVQSAKIVFTTCAGAGLGILRKFDFDIALIDEASQITEPCALIPLVKGTKKGILVGDHVQLRPSVNRMGAALEYDVSMLERLYKLHETPSRRKSMLKIQYRFPEELAQFPSTEFYNGELETGTGDSKTLLAALEGSAFPWPRSGQYGRIVPTVFIQCSEEEDMGGRSASKKNEGQAKLIKDILPLLSQSPQARSESTSNAVAPSKGATQSSPAQASVPQHNPLRITLLTPYTAQVKELKSLTGLKDVYTVDSFQGRESDVIVFSSVRCNLDAEVGFVEDERRLNVMWTRARLGLIVVGDRRTMTERCGIWRRVIGACTEVKMAQTTAK